MHHGLLTDPGMHVSCVCTQNLARTTELLHFISFLSQFVIQEQKIRPHELSKY